MRNKFLKLTALALGVALLAALAVPVVRNSERRILDDDARAEATGDFVRLDPGWVHYQLAGPDTGRVVVLVHGFSVPYYIWDGTFETLARAGFRVLRFDLWGRGYSDRPHVAYDAELFTDQIRGLLDALGLSGPVDVVGLSMGGPVAAGFATRFPDRARRVVLIDPVLVAGDVSPLDVPVLGDYLAAASFVPGLPDGQLGDFYDPSAWPDWPDRYRVQMRYRGFRRAILSTVRHFIAVDPTPLYQGLKGRDVLMFWGAEDHTLPIAASDRFRAEYDVEFHRIEEAGHLPHLEQPGVVDPVLVEFLARGGGGED